MSSCASRGMGAGIIPPAVCTHSPSERLANCASLRTRRRSLQSNVAKRCTSAYSIAVRGQCSYSSWPNSSSNAALSSGSVTTTRAKTPCRVAFLALFALPSGVRGPVLLIALRRLDSLWRSLVICFKTPTWRAHVWHSVAVAPRSHLATIDLRFSKRTQICALDD